MVTVPDVQGLTMEQADAYLADAGLHAVPFIDKPETAGSGAGFPTTYNVNSNEPAETGGAGADTGTQPPAVIYNVYKQFPIAGVEVQRGTQIKLKVRE
jgi:beta-lactam-binding protein with PASTA domain